MNRQLKNRLYLFVILVIVSILFLSGSKATYSQTMSVSIPSLHITDKERVVGFEIHVKSGRIAQLPNVPIGWNVSVDNDASWNTLIKGSSTVAAAAVSPSFFRHFLIVEKNESLGIPFDIQGEVVVTEDFKTERRMNIGIKDLLIKTVTAKGSGGSK